jgi:hypothetical protein
VDPIIPLREGPSCFLEYNASCSVRPHQSQIVFYLFAGMKVFLKTRWQQRPFLRGFFVSALCFYYRLVEKDTMKI